MLAKKKKIFYLTFNPNTRQTHFGFKPVFWNNPKNLVGPTSLAYLNGVYCRGFVSVVYVNAPLCDFYVNIFPPPHPASLQKKKNVFGNRTDVITAKFWEALLSKQVMQDFVLVLPYRI